MPSLQTADDFIRLMRGIPVQAVKSCPCQGWGLHHHYHLAAEAASSISFQGDLGKQKEDVRPVNSHSEIRLLSVLFGSHRRADSEAKANAKSNRRTAESGSFQFG